MKILTKLKPLISLTLSAAVALGAVCASTLPVEAGSRISYYDCEKAVQFASKNWNSGIGLCDGFARDTAKAAGVDIHGVGGAGNVCRALMAAGGMTYRGGEENFVSVLPKMTLNSNGHATKAGNPDIIPGQIVVQYCETCKRAPHLLIFSNFDSDGIARYWAHNNAKNKEVYNLGVNSGHPGHTMSAYVLNLPHKHVFEKDSHFCKHCSAIEMTVIATMQCEKRTTVNYTTLRSEPYSDARITISCPGKGTALSVTGLVINNKKEEFFRVQYHGKTYYVEKNALR